MLNKVHVWSETTGTLYVIPVRPIIFHFLIEQVVFEEQIGYPVLMDLHVQYWIVWNFDARHNGIGFVVMLKSNKSIIDVI